MTSRLQQGRGALLLPVLLSALWYAGCTPLPGEKPLPPTVAPRLLYESGLSQLASGEYLQARRSFEQVVALAPTQATYRNALGFANLHLGRLPQAMDAFREALKLYPDFPDAYNNLGVALAQNGQWDEALAAFEKVLTFPAYNTPELVYQNLGWAYYNLGRYPEAEAALSTALRVDPRLPLAHYTLGLTWEKRGRVQEAQAAYRRVLELVPQDSETGRRAQERLQALGG